MTIWRRIRRFFRRLFGQEPRAFEVKRMPLRKIRLSEATRARLAAERGEMRKAPRPGPQRKKIIERLG